MTESPPAPITTEPYPSDDDHAHEELALIRAYVERLAVARRARGEGTTAAAPPLDVRDLVEVTRRIEGRVLASRFAGRMVPFDRLRHTFALTPTEQRVVWLLAALELDTTTRELAQYVVGDPGRPVADLGFLGHAAYGGNRGRWLAELGPDARLFANGLIEACGASHRDLPFALRRVRLSDRILALLHGIDRLDGAVAAVATLMTSPPALESLVAPDALKREVITLITAAIEHAARGEPHPVLLLSGSEGSGRRALVAGAARQLGLSALIVDGRALSGDPRRLRELARPLLREAALWRAVLVIADVDELAGEQAGSAMEAVDDVLVEGLAGPVVATCGLEGAAKVRFRRGVVRLAVPSPNEGERAELWRRHLDGADPTVIDFAASRYRVTPGTIASASRSAIARVGAVAAVVTADDVRAGVSTTMNAKLTSLASPIIWRPSWDQLILPENAHLEVRELVARVRHRKLVHDDWGFADVGGKGLGLSALFHGPPGTGKTMAAGLIAGELGLDLYQIDLSRIVSKWVGETEKNLAGLFDAAEAGHAILLFDEADALFAKRTEVKSSVDRYANLEVNYLLQRLESFHGVSILTTNHDTAIDEAFRRRLAFRIQFPMPEEDERLALWRKHLPAAARVASRLDLQGLAERFAMSGGYIRNAALRAAFLAADEGTEIRLEHLSRAASLEYAAMGKVMHQSSGPPARGL